MPSTNNGNGTRYKTALDTELGKKIVMLERDFYRYVDVAMPKKHRYTLVTHCEQRLTDARDLIVEGMDYEIDIYPSEKHRLLTKARAALRKVFDFHDNDCHVTLKPTATRKAWFMRKNRERKRQTPLWPR